MKNGSNCFRTIAQIWYYTLNIAVVNRKAEGALEMLLYLYQSDEILNGHRIRLWDIGLHGKGLNMIGLRLRFR